MPDDFNEHYFLSAPADQQLPTLEGGEIIRCFNMTPEGLLTLIVPTIDVPVRYLFRDGAKAVASKLDTVLIEPEEERVVITWRCRAHLGHKLNALRGVEIGQTVAAPRTRNGKPHFKSIADYISWKSRKPS